MIETVIYRVVAREYTGTFSGALVEGKDYLGDIMLNADMTNRNIDPNTEIIIPMDEKGFWFAGSYTKQLRRGDATYLVFQREVKDNE